MAGQAVDLALSNFLLFSLVVYPVLGAASLTYLYDKSASLAARLGAGVVAGQIIAGFIGYVLAAKFGLKALTSGVTAGICLLPLLLFTRPEKRAALRRDAHRLWNLHRKHSASRWLLRGAFGITLCLLLVLMRGAFIQNETGYYTNNHHNLGDLAFHLAVVQNFVLGDNFPPQHPEFARVPLTYPFLVDFITAQWAACGMSLPGAIWLQNALLCAALLVLMQRWLLFLTRRALAVALGPIILLLSGGWGFVMLGGDLKNYGGNVSALLSHLPHDYTIGINNYQWGNALTTLFTTQRGILLAFPVALLIWTVWWQARAESGGAQIKRPDRTVKLLASGLLCGFLPLVHGHTFLCVMIGAAYFAACDLFRFVRNRRSNAVWDGLYFFVPALVLALPQIALLSNHSAARADAFIAWNLGWVCENENFAWFWFRITGPFLPLLCAAVLWRGTTPRRLLAFYIPFVLLFVLANGVRLAPWAWDNIKVLFVWHAASVPLVALVLARLWRGTKRTTFGARLPARIAVVVLFCGLTLSGGLDVWRVLRDTPYQEFDREAIAFAHQIAQVSPPNAVILSAPTYNHPALLSGRHVLLGYRGHLWSHGLDYEPRWKEAQAIYKGDANAPDLLKKWGVWGVVVGPVEERGQEDVTLDPAFWSRYPVAAQVGPWKLYRVGPDKK